MSRSAAGAPVSRSAAGAPVAACRGSGMRRRREGGREGGFALPAVLLVIALLAVIAGGVAREAAATARGLGHGGQDIQAFHLAGAGLEYALASLRGNPGFTGANRPLGAGTFDVTVRPDGTDLVLTSTGTVGPVRRVQTMRVRRSLPPPYRRRVFTLSDLTLDKGVLVDGDVYGGEDVRLRKGAQVTGRVEATGRVRLDGGTAGAVAEGVPAESLPPIDFGVLRAAATILYPNDRTLAGPQTYNDDIVFVDGNLTVGGVIAGRVTFVATGSVDVEGELRLADDGSGVAIIAQRTISIDKGIEASALLISEQRVRLEKNATLHGNAVAPDVNIDSARLLPPAGADPASLPGLPATGLEVVDWMEVIP